MNQPGRVTVFGHRGSPEREIENTIPSFLSALEQGADGIELDVHMSADGHVVVFHDADLGRLSNRTDNIYSLTLSELQSIKLHVEGMPDGFIPTLEQVFEVVPPDKLINVELKGVGVEPNGLEQAVSDLSERFNRTEKIIISSFNPVRLRRIRGINPGLRTALLHYGRLDHFPFRTELRIAGRVDGLHPCLPLVDQDYMIQARTHGRFVNVWTVNQKDDMLAMIEMGVDGIITNLPGTLVELIS